MEHKRLIHQICFELSPPISHPPEKSNFWQWLPGAHEDIMLTSRKGNEKTGIKMSKAGKERAPVI